MATPKILSYFSQSNNPDDPYLKSLVEESAAIQKTWETFKDTVFDIDFLPRNKVEVGKIEEDIRKYKHNIIVFHFSGHAGNEQLMFANGAANANGLAGLLGEAQNLKLVFLNGCATYDQVNFLLKNNIKVIVATKGKVKDGIAKDFAETFYSALINEQYTIKEAFEHTINALKITNTSFNDISVEPHFWRGSLNIADDENDRWELYVNDKNKSEIEKKQWWKLNLINPTVSETINGSTSEDKVLKYLIILTVVVGISMFVYFAFKDKFQFASLGVVLNLGAFFGYKNAQKYRTVEFNQDYIDSELVRKIKLGT